MRQRRPPPRFNQTRHDFIDLDGGLDTETPPFKLASGRARTALNYEIKDKGGYRRVSGYERYDGQARPSDALYAVLNATSIGTYALGDTLTGATSGATGIIIAATATYFVLTKVTGTYVTGENLQISAVTQGVASSTQATSGASSSLLDAQYKNLAADEYRGDIAAVPGSGDVLGVWVFDDVRYAARNNAGGTAAAIYKSSSSGWALVALGRELAFTSGGTDEIEEGDTITGATSGATAVVTRVMLESGSWAAGTAAGKFIFASQTGTFVAENINVGASLNLATIAGDGTAITLLPDGRFETIAHNFGGTVNTRRIYGCDGVNRGFEFDGTVFCPIKTGMTTDAPRHVTEHKNHLVFSFGASTQTSGPTTPYQWTLLAGAAELAMGDTITGFMSLPGNEGGGALAIITRQRISVLYGSGVDDWNLVPFDKDAGGYEWTIQRIGMTIMLDDRGLASLQTTANFGNFNSATLTQQIQKWINDQRTKASASCLIRDKNQYRIFFSDKYALTLTFDGKKIRGMAPQLYAHDVTCTFSGELNSGVEIAYFGSSDGFVYQMDVGTSFDGEEIEAYLDFAYNHSGSPRNRKRFKKALIETQGEGYSEFQAYSEIGYGAAEITQQAQTTITASFAAAQWDVFTWDQFVWDGTTLLPSEFRLKGTAENCSVRIYSKSDYFASITFSAVVQDYSERRRKR